MVNKFLQKADLTGIGFFTILKFRLGYFHSLLCYPSGRSAMAAPFFYPVGDSGSPGIPAAPPGEQHGTTVDLQGCGHINCVMHYD